LQSKYKNLNCPAKQSRGCWFSGYSFTTVCIEPAGPNAGLYAVLEDQRARAKRERELEEASENKNLRNIA
jgi:hypothetical protein